jgi:hypothetical protein
MNDWAEMTHEGKSYIKVCRLTRLLSLWLVIYLTLPTISTPKHLASGISIRVCRLSVTLCGVSNIVY